MYTYLPGVDRSKSHSQECSGSDVYRHRRDAVMEGAGSRQMGREVRVLWLPPPINPLELEFSLKIFSTPCISNVNITGTKKGSIMK
jgi:hypothetical protein